MNKIWFRRKLYGWGWTPSSWEGWLVLLVWLIFFTFGVVKMDHEGLKNIAVIGLMTGLLIYVCYRKGEKPRWQWGKQIEDLPDDKNKTP